MTDWKALEDAEDHAYFMAELMDRCCARSPGWP